MPGVLLFLLGGPPVDFVVILDILLGNLVGWMRSQLPNVNSDRPKIYFGVMTGT